MKRSVFTLLASLLLFYAVAQKSSLQRIAFAPINMKIPARGESAEIKWFCYDELRGSPAGLVSSFKQVHFDGQTALAFGNAVPITLQEALNKNSVELIDTYDGFILKNNTGQPLQVITNDVTLLGDVKNDLEDISKTVLSVIKEKGEQPNLWLERNKVYVFNNEDLLKTMNPSHAELQAAEEEYRKLYGITSNDLLRKSIENRIYEIRNEATIKPKKIKVYQYKKLITSDNPTKEQLKAADNEYAKNNSSQNRTYYRISDEYELINRKTYVLQKEELVNLNNPTIEELIEAEAKFQKSKGLEGDALEKEFRKKYEQYRNEIYNAEYALDLLISGDWEKNIKIFEKELNLPETGKLNNPKLISALDFYYRSAYPFFITELRTPEDFIRETKKLKTSLGLNNNFQTDENTFKFFDNLDEIFKNKGLSRWNTNYRKVHNGKIYIVSDQADKSYIFSFDLASKEWKTVREFTYSNGFYIDKIEGDLYQMGDELVEVDNLYPTIEKRQVNQDIAYTFGDYMSEVDKQSLISTGKIKKLAAGKNLQFGSDIKVTSRLYDFSAAPKFEVKPAFLSNSEKDIILIINRKSQVPVGSGIIGRLKYEIYDVANSMVNSIKTRISNIYIRMRGNNELDFADQLRVQLEQNGITKYVINATMDNVEVTIQIFKFDQNEPKYSFNNKSN